MNGTTTRNDNDYRGRLLYRSETAESIVEVVETDTTRAMHFGTPARQSCMWLHDPERLQLPYTRAMMSFLLLLPDVPRRVLMLGLGGGSIAKFLLHGFPQCEVHAVERSSEVIALARRYFALPDSERLQVHAACAEDFVAHSAAAGHFDAVLVDTFDAAGAARCIGQQAFIDQCKSALNDHGVLAINLWRGRATGYRETLAAMARAFAEAPMQLPVPKRGNVIAFASRKAGGWKPLQDIDARARAYERSLQLDFTGYLHNLHRGRNGWFRWLRR